MRTESPTHISKVIAKFKHLFAKPNESEPIDQHLAIEAFQFLVTEWEQENPRGPLKAFIRYQKAQGLI